MEIIQKTSGFFSKVFALLITLVFFTSEIGVLDHVCRLTADIAHCKGIVRNESKLLSEGAMYLYTLWAMIIGGIVILLGFNINQPPRLLVTAGVLSGIAMFVYSVAIVALNVMAGREWKSRFQQDNADFNPFSLPLCSNTQTLLKLASSRPGRCSPDIIPSLPQQFPGFYRFAKELYYLLGYS